MIKQPFKDVGEDEPKPVFEQLLATAPESMKQRIESLKKLRERPDFHPEESAFEHVRIVTERGLITGTPELIAAAMLHDICKLETMTINKKGYPTCIFHAEEAVKLILRSVDSDDIQEWIKAQGADVAKVADICLYHMQFKQLHKMRPHKQETKTQMWKEKGVFDLLVTFSRMDNMTEDF